GWNTGDANAKHSEEFFQSVFYSDGDFSNYDGAGRFPDTTETTGARPGHTVRRDAPRAQREHRRQRRRGRPHDVDLRRRQTAGRRWSRAYGSHGDSPARQIVERP